MSEYRVLFLSFKSDNSEITFMHTLAISENKKHKKLLLLQLVKHIWFDLLCQILFIYGYF